MNRGYIIGQNKVAAIDKEIIKVENYTDNFEKILEVENIIEEIQNKILRANKKQENIKEEKIKAEKENITNIITILLINTLIILLKSKTGELISISNITNYSIIALGITVNTILFLKTKNDIKEANKIKLENIETNQELIFLKNRYKKEEKKLEELKKTSKKANTVNINKVEYREVDLSNILKLEKEINNLKIKKRIRGKKND